MHSILRDSSQSQDIKADVANSNRLVQIEFYDGNFLHGAFMAKQTSTVPAVAGRKTKQRKVFIDIIPQILEDPVSTVQVPRANKTLAAERGVRQPYFSLVANVLRENLVLSGQHFSTRGSEEHMKSLQTKFKNGFFFKMEGKKKIVRNHCFLLAGCQNSSMQGAACPLPPSYRSGAAGSE